MLLLCKTSTSASFRAIVIFIYLLYQVLSLTKRVPCYNTLRMWMLKVGYYELTKEQEKYDDVVVIIDGSIQFGKDKIYLMYGIRQSEIPTDRALKLSDLMALYLVVKETWNGEIISNELICLNEKVGKIVYMVCDKGSELVKGIRLAGIPHIYDITHKLANLLESMFEKDKTYKSVTEKMSTMRNKLAQTDAAFIIPNAQRKKSFYQNMKTISDWLVKFQSYIKSGKYKDKLKDKTEMLEWVLEKETFITEFSILNELICKIEKIVKTKGLSKETKFECLNLFNEILENSYTEKLKTEFIIYADEMLSKVPYNRILCTSDIIESAFGKYKNYVSSNPMCGVTSLALSLAAFTSDFSIDTIKKALESTTINHINAWNEDNIKESLLKKRRDAFKFT